jgi:sugar diacid utilization regulator
VDAVKRRARRDELHGLIERVYRTRRTRARIIIEESLRILPHYRAASAARLAVVRRSVLHHLTLFYRVTLETGRPLEADDLAPSRRTARKRAAEGVPLGEFLTFFQIGLTVIWDHLMTSAGDSPALRQRLLDRVGAIISNQTQLMTALVEAYVEERERLSRFREQDLDDFVQLLLADEATETVLEERARALGIPLDAAHAVAIFGPAEDSRAEVGPEELRLRLAERLPKTQLWLGRSREGFVAVLPEAADLEDLGERRVGLGSAGRGAQQLRRSAREALRALRIGMLLQSRGQAISYRDVAVLDLVDVGSAGADEFAGSVLGPLVRAGASRAHLETLRQLVAHGHRIKLAAAALSIHPHTLTYRLKQIRRRYGIDLDDPEVRLRVHLALRILEARGRLSPRHKTPPA